MRPIPSILLFIRSQSSFDTAIRTFSCALAGDLPSSPFTISRPDRTLHLDSCQLPALADENRYDAPGPVAAVEAQAVPIHQPSWEKRSVGRLPEEEVAAQAAIAPSNSEEAEELGSLLGNPLEAVAWVVWGTPLAAEEEAVGAVDSSRQADLEVQSHSVLGETVRESGQAESASDSRTGF